MEKRASFIVSHRRGRIFDERRGIEGVISSLVVSVTVGNSVGNSIEGSFWLSWIIKDKKKSYIGKSMVSIFIYNRNLLPFVQSLSKIASCWSRLAINIGTEIFLWFCMIISCWIVGVIRFLAILLSDLLKCLEFDKKISSMPSLLQISGLKRKYINEYSVDLVSISIGRL